MYTLLNMTYGLGIPCVALQKSSNSKLQMELLAADW